MRLNQDSIAASELAARLQQILQTRSDRGLFLQAEGQLLYNDVAHVIDVVRGAGATRIALMTGHTRNAR